MRAALYARVSTDEQAADGFSLDAQLTRLKSYCQSQGWTIHNIYVDDGYSAKSLDRPQMQKMLADLQQSEFDVVVVYRLDRLTRSVLNLHELLDLFDKHNVKFKSCSEIFETTTAMGRLFITIIAAIAEWERNNLSERTKMGQLEMTKQGKWSGGNPPFGYDFKDGELLINESQATVVRYIFQRYTDGQGTRSILQWLNDPASPQLAPNRRWTQWALKYLLGNPIYKGYVRYGYRTVGGRRQKNPIVEPGKHPPIISEELFEKAQHVKAERSKMSGRAGTGTFAFSGILYCGLCGSAMAGLTRYRTNRATSPPRRYYVCGERQHSGLCKMPNIREDKIETQILADIAEFRKELMLQLSDADTARSTIENLKKSIANERQKLDNRKKRFMTAYGDGAIDTAELGEQLKQIREREQQLDAQLANVAQDNNSDRLRRTATVLETLQASWEVLTVVERKQILNALIKRVDVMPDSQTKITYA